MKLQLLISNLIVCILFTLFITQVPRVYAYAPYVLGQVETEGTNVPISGVWIRWEDDDDAVRYAQTDSTGKFRFDSWHRMSDENRHISSGIAIDTNLDGQTDVTESNTTEGGQFGCVQSPHTFSVVSPHADHPLNGIYTPEHITIDLNNSDFEVNIGTFKFQPVDPPSNLNWKCDAHNKITLSWNPVAGAESYVLRVDNLADGWDGSCNSPGGDVCVENISGSSHQVTVDATARYRWWVHARYPSGQWSEQVNGSEMQCNPNCSNLTGPTTIQVGQTATYTAQFESLEGSLAGEIFYDSMSSLGLQRPDGKNATLSSTWTPTLSQVGTHTISCRAWNDSIAECRPPGLVDRPPRFACKGPGYSLTVTVSAANTPTPTIRTSITPTRMPTPTVTITPPVPTPASCGSVCSSDAQCSGGLSCVTGVCRNPLCPIGNDSDCRCTCGLVGCGSDSQCKTNYCDTATGECTDNPSANCTATGTCICSTTNVACNDACTTDGMCATSYCHDTDGNGVKDTCRLNANPSSTTCTTTGGGGNQWCPF